MSFSVGIDLGTTNTVVSTARKGLNSNVEVVTEAIDQIGEDGFSLTTSNLLPSVLFVDSGVPTVGLMAKAMKGQTTNRVILNSKNYIGESNYKWDINGEEYTPELVASYFLSAIRKHLVEKYKDEESINSAVITVPASFNLDQRNSTKNAARLAGFSKDITLISEPTAAILDFINEQSKIADDSKVIDLSSFKNILVFDLGGGTCDVAILKVKIKGKEIYVKELSVSPHTLIGGTNFDAYAVEGIIKNFEKQNSLDLKEILDKETFKMLRNKLLIQLEKAKIFFSTKYFQNNIGNVDKEELQKSISIPIQIPNIINGNAFKISLTMDKYNSYIKPLLTSHKGENVINPINEALVSANFKKSDIDYIFGVGGMTKYPEVNKTIVDYFGQEIMKFTDLMESVSRGASVYHYYDIHVDDNEETMIDVIPTLPQTVFLNVKNSFPIPLIKAKTEAGTPIIHNELIEVTSETEISLELYSGMSRIDPKMKKLENITMEFPFGIESGTKVSLKLEYTKRGILMFEAWVPNNPHIKIHVKLEGNKFNDVELQNLNNKYYVSDVRGVI